MVRASYQSRYACNSFHYLLTTVAHPHTPAHSTSSTPLRSHIELRSSLQWLLWSSTPKLYRLFHQRLAHQKHSFDSLRSKIFIVSKTCTYKIKHEILIDWGLAFWDLSGNILINKVKVGALTQDHIVLPLNHIESLHKGTDKSGALKHRWSHNLNY